MTKDAFDNAIVTLMAIGGSTNAIVHLMALAGRARVPLTLERFDELSQTTPVLANVRPAGKFVMEDFFDAGGLRGLMSQIVPLLNTDALSVAGGTLGEAIAGAEVYDPDVIRSVENPICLNNSLAVLRGNLCPDGAIIKPAAADAKLQQHTGPAVVFSDYADLKARIDDPSLNITADHVIVLQNAGPIGAPGIPEWGMLPIPKALLEQGIRDMVRISDARMSGTSYGTCVLHVSPESAVGGPLALVHDGDMITLDVAGRSLQIDVTAEDLANRRRQWTPPPKRYTRGYGHLLEQEITQACDGCDFRFLQSDGSQTPEPDIY
jgi:dihydroxy-acid dehydratase